MRNQRFLIYELTPPDLAFGQIGKTRHQICDLFFFSRQLVYLDQSFGGHNFEQLGCLMARKQKRGGR